MRGFQTLDVVPSPRINSLIQSLQSNKPDVVEAFWQQLENEGTPLIEPIENEPNWCIVTFLWRGTKDTQQVLLIVDTLTDHQRRDDLSGAFLRNIENTDIWHISYRLRSDLRTCYEFYPVSTQQTALSTGAKNRQEWLNIVTNTLPDPFNPQTFPSRRSETPISVLVLHDAPDHPWWQVQAENPTGNITQHSLSSKLLNNERSIWIYTPEDYTAEQSYPLLLMLDGESWIDIAGLKPTLDNLIAAGEIPPMIAITIDSIDGETRSEELTCNQLFIQFLTDELLPWARRKWAITDDPTQTIIAGQSFGGLAAAFAGFTAPSIFGNVLSQSGSFWWKDTEGINEDAEWLNQQFACAASYPLQFYISVGWMEGSLLKHNRHLHDVLIAKGYDADYREHNTGHDYIAWQGDLAEGLISLTQRWGNNTSPVKTTYQIKPIEVSRTSTIPPQILRPDTLNVAESPRIKQLKADLDAGNTASLTTFWEQVSEEGTPLIEPVKNEPDQCIVTFLWRGGDEIEKVVIQINKFTDASALDDSMMEHIPHSDVWHRSYKMRSDWRASYKLAPFKISEQNQELGADVARLVNRAVSVGSKIPRATLEQWALAMQQSIADPFNTVTYQGFSVLELPHSPRQDWLIEQNNITKGTVSEHTLHSDILKNERTVWVYTPAEYASNKKPYSLLVLLDGQSWMQDNSLITTLDNLIAQGKIPPMIVIMPDALDFETRVREMAAYPPFVQFLSDELLVWASENWHITSNPAQTIISGLSLGGLTATLTGLIASNRFGNVLSQSGSFWWANGSELDQDSEWLAQQYARMPKQPIKIYMEVGIQEWVLLPATRHLRNVLTAKGYELIYSEYNGGHDKACYRGSIADGLIALTETWK